MTKYLFVISVIDSNAKPWEGFNVGHDKRCKVTYVAPAGSQLTITSLTWTWWERELGKKIVTRIT